MQEPSKINYLIPWASLWLLSIAVEFWLIAPQYGSPFTALGYAIGNTSVMAVLGFFALRRARKLKEIISRSAVIAALFAVLLLININEGDVELTEQISAACSQSASQTFNIEPEITAYCECLSTGALPIVKSAARRSVFGITTGDPMDDPIYISAMKSLAGSCFIPSD